MKRIVPMVLSAFAVLGCEEPTASAPDVTITVTQPAVGESLALTLTEGHYEELSVEIAITGEGTADGVASDAQSLGPLTFSLNTFLVEAGPRSLRFRLVLSKLALGGPAPQAEESTIRSRTHRAITRMPALQGEMVVTREGIVTKLTLEAEKGLSNQQRQVVEAVRMAIEQLVIARPAEAARAWTVEAPVSRGGFDLAQKLELSLEKNGVLRLSAIETAYDQTAAPPGAYADSIAVEKFVSSGSGELRIRPTQLFPMAAQLEWRAHTALSIEQANATDKVESRSTLSVRARSTVAAQGAIDSTPK